MLLDERVFTAPDGESMLIPVPEDLSASALALCEPWACVENAYVGKQRRALKADGKMLVVGETPVEPRDSPVFLRLRQAGRHHVGDRRARFAGLKDAGFDDMVYFGAIRGNRRPGSSRRWASRGLWSTWSCAGANLAGRWSRRSAGSTTEASGSSAPPAPTRPIRWPTIPATAKSGPSDKINIVGAAGPMGTMHVIRDLCQGVPASTVFAGDLSDERLAMLCKSSPSRWPRRTG